MEFRLAPLVRVVYSHSTASCLSRSCLLHVFLTAPDVVAMAAAATAAAAANTTDTMMPILEDQTTRQRAEAEDIGTLASTPLC